MCYQTYNITLFFFMNLMALTKSASRFNSNTLIKPHSAFNVNSPAISRLTEKDSIKQIHIDEKTCDGVLLNTRDNACLTVWIGSKTYPPMNVDFRYHINRAALNAIRNDRFFSQEKNSKLIKEAELKFKLFCKRPDIKIIDIKNLSSYIPIKHKKQLLFIVEDGKAIRASDSILVFSTQAPHAAIEIIQKKSDMSLWALLKHPKNDKYAILPLKHIGKAKYHFQLKSGLKALISNPSIPICIRFTRKTNKILQSIYKHSIRTNATLYDSHVRAANAHILKELNTAFHSINDVAIASHNPTKNIFPSWLRLRAKPLDQLQTRPRHITESESLTIT